jgi:hypothetical protein
MIFFGHGDRGVFYAFDAKGQNMYVKQLWNWNIE